MASKIQLRRGLKSALPTLSSGEPAYITDTRELYVGTGSGNVNMGGSHWYTGTAISGTSSTTGAYSYSACPQVKVGDCYLNTTYGYVYQCTTAGSGTGAKWTYKGSIKGATGATGPTGPKGATGAAGTDVQAVYSQTPAKVGTWIDGKAIYRVAWTFTIAEYKNIGVAYSFYELPNCPSGVVENSVRGTVREVYCYAPYNTGVELQCFSSVTDFHNYQHNISSNSKIVYCVVEYIAA